MWIAGGERSEPPERMCIDESPERAKHINNKMFRPSRAPYYANYYRGFAALTPGYPSVAAPRLILRFFLTTYGTLTVCAQSDPALQRRAKFKVFILLTRTSDCTPRPMFCGPFITVFGGFLDTQYLSIQTVGVHDLS